MSTPQEPPGQGRRLARAAQVIIVSSVMFTFISYWRTAAIVLCDLASTAFYIGGIVEQAIGPAAPWFILAVLLFSYAVRSLYIESCSLYVRGGVYRVVKDALGGLPAKGAVSALLFDYILNGGPVNRVPLVPDLAPKVEYDVNPEGIDRLTGEARETWKRDPQTGQLIPKLDENGNLVPRLDPLTGRQVDPLGLLARWFPGF